MTRTNTGREHVRATRIAPERLKQEINLSTADAGDGQSDPNRARAIETLHRGKIGGLLSRQSDPNRARAIETVA